MTPYCVNSSSTATTWAKSVAVAFLAQISLICSNLCSCSRTSECVVLVVEHNILVMHVIGHANFNNRSESGGEKVGSGNLSAAEIGCGSVTKGVCPTHSCDARVGSRHLGLKVSLNDLSVCR